MFIFDIGCEQIKTNQSNDRGNCIQNRKEEKFAGNQGIQDQRIEGSLFRME
jgi:hypothetical protein